jgi:hypothetical protein
MKEINCTYRRKGKRREENARHGAGRKILEQKRAKDAE